MHTFELIKPSSLEQAVALLHQHEEAAPLAGGMTLVPTLKQRLAAPTHLVDLSVLAELRGIEQQGSVLRVGAMTRHAELAGAPLVQSVLPGLAYLASVIADRQVRHRGTMGGSIANNDPAADYPAALLALNATVITDQRRIAASDFFIDMFETALQPGEIIVAIEFPLVPGNYAKYRSQASGYAVAGVFVARHADGVKVAVTGAGAAVFRWHEAEAALQSHFCPDALQPIQLAPDTLNGDLHHSAGHKAQLAWLCAREAVRDFDHRQAPRNAPQ